MITAFQVNEMLNAGQILSFKKLAEEFGLTHQSGTIPKNGGQILYEILKDKVDKEKLESLRPKNSGERYRKAKRK